MQRDPIRKWREEYARSFHHIDFEPATNALFHASLKPIFDQPHMVRATLSPGFLFRDKDLVRDGDDSLSLVISQSPKLNVTHQRCEVQLSLGDATLMQASSPGRCGSSDNFGFFEVIIPPVEWEMRSAHPGDAVMQHIRRRSEAMQLLRAYVRCLERLGPAAFVGAREIIRRHVTDLTVLAATVHRPIGESSASAVVAARLTAALDHIAGHFQDPGLSLNAVAHRQGISPRYLQRLMELSGKPFTAHLTELRLQRAFALLIEPHDGARKISDIAMEVGFSDISHFNRLFRARFGDSPRGVRVEVRKSASKPVSGKVA